MRCGSRPANNEGPSSKLEESTDSLRVVHGVPKPGAADVGVPDAIDLLYQGPEGGEKGILLLLPRYENHIIDVPHKPLARFVIDVVQEYASLLLRDLSYPREWCDD